jgi:hypothetical protein
MALPSSGPISMNDVMTELQNTGTTSNIKLAWMGQMNGNREQGFTTVNQNSTTKPVRTSGGSNAPYSLSDWQSYNHTQNGSCSGNSFRISPVETTYYRYHRIEITGGGSGSYSDIFISMGNYTSSTSPRIELHSDYPFTNTGNLTSTYLLYGHTFTGDGTPGLYPYRWNLTTASPRVLHIVCWWSGSSWIDPDNL